jgi:APA family basic amino acid/polyamine antiporter
MTPPAIASPTTPQTPSEPQFDRRLGLGSAIAVVVGSIVGSGIFLTPQNVAAAVEVPGVMIFVWIATGLLTLAGALTNAEIASEITEAGGQYAFFRVLYGDLLAFLFGWTTFIVYQTGSIAAIAVAFARYVGYFIPLPHLSPELEAWKIPLIGNIAPFADIGIKMVAIASIVIVTMVNYVGVRFGNMLQNMFTVMKMLAIASIVVLGFTMGNGSIQHFFPLWGTPSTRDVLSAVGIAMVATLWAYDGWNSLTFMAGEVRNPGRTVPRALILGTVAVILIYVITNMAYLYVLPIAEVAASKLVAADMMDRVFPGYGGTLISLAVIVATFGSVAASCMTTARVTYAMSHDRLFFKSLAKIHPRHKTPTTALIAQAVWAAILTLSGTFDQLFTYVIFAGWIFYALGAAAVFILRRKRPNANREYRVPGYPYVPLAFVAVATWFMVNTVITNPADSMVGILLVVVGIPFYLYWRRGMRAAS